jgi:hypothetical protein
LLGMDEVMEVVPFVGLMGVEELDSDVLVMEVVPFVGLIVVEEVDSDVVLLLLVTGTLLVLLCEDVVKGADEVVGETIGDEEVVKCVQPPLQEVMVRVDVVRVVKVTREGQWLDQNPFGDVHIPTELALDVVYVNGHSC